MKQQITPEQHNAELTTGAMIRLEKWCNPRGYIPTRLTIGQMIELCQTCPRAKDRGTGIDWMGSLFFSPDFGCCTEARWEGELADALWELCKEVLMRDYASEIRGYQ